MNLSEIIEDLMDDDPFIRSYPSFKHYLRAWDEMGGEAAQNVPHELVFEFYADRLEPSAALHIWFTYK